MNEELVAEALIGDEAKKFLESDLGKTLIGMSEQDKELAVLQFSDADITDPKKMRKIQDDIRFALEFRGRIIDLFNRGEEALRVIQDGSKK